MDAFGIGKQCGVRMGGTTRGPEAIDIEKALNELEVVCMEFNHWISLGLPGIQIE